MKNTKRTRPFKLTWSKLIQSHREWRNLHGGWTGLHQVFWFYIMALTLVFNGIPECVKEWISKKKILKNREKKEITADFNIRCHCYNHCRDCEHSSLKVTLLILSRKYISVSGGLKYLVNTTLILFTAQSRYSSNSPQIIISSLPRLCQYCTA